MFFCSPFLFALKSNLKKIYIKLENDKAYFYDLKDLSKKL